MVSTTDPDAPCVSKGAKSGTARPRYKHHRAVDDRCGVITAVVTTAGDKHEASQVMPLLTQHTVNTGSEAAVAVADRAYGTVDNYCELINRGIAPHMAPIKEPDANHEGRFGKADFLYDEKADRYICPAGKELLPKRVHKHRKMTDYVARAEVCAQCPLRAQCTDSKLGRSVARHWRELDLEKALDCAAQPEARKDRQRRWHLMEGSFAQAANSHHFKRARWRRMWRQQIQDWLIAAVQNIAKLCKATGSGVGAKIGNGPVETRGRAVLLGIPVFLGAISSALTLSVQKTR
jgi:hypothetical protein